MKEIYFLSGKEMIIGLKSNLAVSRQTNKQKKII